MIKTAYNFGKTSSNIKNFQDAVGAGMSDLDGIGPVADKLAPELDENIEMLRGLAQSGATFDTIDREHEGSGHTCRHAVITVPGN